MPVEELTMLLLAPDTVDLHGPSAAEDAFGWTEPDGGVVWTGPGNLQLTGGASDPRASEGGGSGPFGPAHNPTGQIFLPADAPVVGGSTVDVRGRTYVLSAPRVVVDPLALGLDCWVADVAEVTSWPA